MRSITVPLSVDYRRDYERMTLKKSQNEYDISKCTSL